MTDEILVVFLTAALSAPIETRHRMCRETDGDDWGWKSHLHSATVHTHTHTQTLIRECWFDIGMNLHAFCSNVEFTNYTKYAITNKLCVCCSLTLLHTFIRTHSVTHTHVHIHLPKSFLCSSWGPSCSDVIACCHFADCDSYWKQSTLI